MKTSKITLQDGRTIEHLDVIHNRTYTSFSFRDKIKILFGAKVTIDSEIFTMNERVDVSGSQSRASVY